MGLEYPVSESLHGAPRAIFAGWELGSIFSAHTGVPLRESEFGYCFYGKQPCQQQRRGQRPNFNPIPGCSTNPVNSWDNPKLHQSETASHSCVGNARRSGTQYVTRPGFVDFDFSCSETSAPPGKVKLNSRGSLQRVNHANYGVQNYWPSLAVNNTTPLTSAGQLQPPTLTTSRQIQLGVKFIF